MSIPVPARSAARTAALLLAVLLATACNRRDHSSSSGTSSEALTGRIYTTDVDGEPTADDVFAQACDVYVSGGPLEDQDGPGLPPGEYYLQVTDEAGTVLLSLEGPDNGVITVSAGGPDGAGVFVAYEGEHETVDGQDGAGLRLRLCPLQGSSPDGRYRVWLTSLTTYAPGEGTFGFRDERSVSHVFELSSGSIGMTDLVIRRFCDQDADGSPEGEAFLDDVRYMVSVSSIDDGMPFEVRTGETVPGEARVAGIPAPATFTVCELVPGTGMAGASWYGTHPVFGGGGGGTACHVGVLDGSDEVAVQFGAACVMQSVDGMAGTAFLTEQGKAILQANDPAWRQLLDGAGLVTADGAAFDVPDGSFFAAFAGFSNWMAAAGTVNEAHLLSREIAASLLAGAYAGLDPGETHVLRPANAACYGAHTATTAALVQAAQALVRDDGFTPEGDPNAAAQRCVRDALAGVNTNAAPVLNGHCCDVVYP